MVRSSILCSCGKAGRGGGRVKNSVNGLTHCKLTEKNSEISFSEQMVACMLMRYILNSGAGELCGLEFSHERISRHFLQ